MKSRSLEGFPDFLLVPGIDQAGRFYSGDKVCFPFCRMTCENFAPRNEETIVENGFDSVFIGDRCRTETFTCSTLADEGKHLKPS